MTTHSHDDIVLADDVKEQAKRLAEEAAKDPSELVNDMLRDAFALREEIREEVRLGREDVAGGRVVEHEKVRDWLLSWGTDNEQPRPRPK